ncbi:hypothetical protein FB451DRAFT_1188952 [Mycena latifolia]|nr:hypothetical protein FB451DRAFT_1188952 [Mycena latifolia]
MARGPWNKRCPNERHMQRGREDQEGEGREREARLPGSRTEPWVLSSQQREDAGKLNALCLHAARIKNARDAQQEDEYQKCRARLLLRRVLNVLRPFGRIAFNRLEALRSFLKKQKKSEVQPEIICRAVLLTQRLLHARAPGATRRTGISHRLPLTGRNKDVPATPPRTLQADSDSVRETRAPTPPRRPRADDALCAERSLTLTARGAAGKDRRCESSAAPEPVPTMDDTTSTLKTRPARTGCHPAPHSRTGPRRSAMRYKPREGRLPSPAHAQDRPRMLFAMRSVRYAASRLRGGRRVAGPRGAHPEGCAPARVPYLIERGRVRAAAGSEMSGRLRVEELFGYQYGYQSMLHMEGVRAHVVCRNEVQLCEVVRWFPRARDAAGTDSSALKNRRSQTPRCYEYNQRSRRQKKGGLSTHGLPASRGLSTGASGARCAGEYYAPKMRRAGTPRTQRVRRVICAALIRAASSRECALEARTACLPVSAPEGTGSDAVCALTRVTRNGESFYWRVKI